jgi:hypothetical protein
MVLISGLDEPGRFRVDLSVGSKPLRFHAWAVAWSLPVDVAGSGCPPLPWYEE